MSAITIATLVAIVVSLTVNVLTWRMNRKTKQQLNRVNRYRNANRY